MKNKDGIELKVGQVWTDKDGKIERTILVFTSTGGVVTEVDGMICVWPTHSQVFHTLVSDPDQPWLPQYKLSEMDWIVTNGDLMDEVCPLDPDNTTGYQGYMTSDGYRIFGYTDDADILECPASRPWSEMDWSTDACCPYGNRKYAIGRKEA